MELRFPIQRIKAQLSLSEKLESLGTKPYLHRIFAKVSIINSDKSRTIPIKAIVDTGATFSLFPDYLLKGLTGIMTVEHTVSGILDIPECHIRTQLCLISVVLVDINEETSPELEILAAFSTKANIPPLLGMYGILAEYPSFTDLEKNEFILKVQ